MTQALLDNLSLDQKTQTKHLLFHSSGTTSFSGHQLTFYDDSGYRGDINLSLFPNLRLITFKHNVNVNSLESIEISENAKLNKIVMAQPNAVNPFNTQNYPTLICSLIVRERQLNHVIVNYTRYRFVNQQWIWQAESELLKNQTAIPTILIDDDRNFEKLEAEAERLKQLLAEKDQQIEQFKKDSEQTPTLSQFQELNDIALPGVELDFDNLKREVKRLKSKDFTPYFQEQKINFTKSISSAKDKAGTNLEMFLELFLQTQKQLLEQTDESDTKFVQGQLLAYQNILQTKLDQEELQDLLTKQKEMFQLENQLKSLQIQKI